MQDPKVKNSEQSPELRAAVLLQQVTQFKDFNENNVVKGSLLRLLTIFIKSEDAKHLTEENIEDVTLSVTMLNELIDAVYNY